MKDSNQDYTAIADEETADKALLDADQPKSHQPMATLGAVPLSSLGGKSSSSKYWHAFKVGSYFGLWYLFNVGYNIYNKRVLNDVPLYWMGATIQLFVGVVYIAILWLTRLRTCPTLTLEDIKTLMPIAVFHMLAHIGAVVSLGAGAVSFTHIVKSGEPVFTSVMSGLVLGQYFRWPVYATLLPIIIGVAIASLTELEFSWMSFIGAMVSNLSASLRAIFSKAKMQKPVGENLTPANLYGVLTILSFLMALPLTLAVEGYRMLKVYRDEMGGKSSSVEWSFWGEVALSGLTFYLYNEVAFLALSEVHPVTHAVGNTIKRVVIIVVTVIVFGNTITTMGAFGCTVAILGTFMYSIAKQHFGAKK